MLYSNIMEYASIFANFTSFLSDWSFRMSKHNLICVNQVERFNSLL
ncbi:unnamed protein product [Chironomus riparius]|uniref:Uncharacterized protein n=1 Tax=Chironomus riparius TaxID=315576 RepID=A0A9N9RRU8_9DIPT|nr:unnamed protein product [Chironomus riparius]